MYNFTDFKSSFINNENILGESPLWNYDSNKFFWVDIEENHIKSFDDHHIQIYDLHSPTCIGLIDANQLFTAVADGVGIFDLRTKSFNYLDKIDNPKVRFNDGKCSRNGIFYLGTMCKKRPRMPIGSLYTFSNKKLIPFLDNISTTNGISFSADNDFMYYSDTPNKYICQKNMITGETSYTYTKFGPDGSTVDLNGRYYSCLWGGSSINIYDSYNYDDNEQMKLYDTIDLPFILPTCCCYGGNDLNKLFITSATCGGGSNGKPMLINTDITGIKEEKVTI